MASPLFLIKSFNFCPRFVTLKISLTSWIYVHTNISRARSERHLRDSCLLENRVW